MRRMRKLGRQRVVRGMSVEIVVGRNLDKKKENFKPVVYRSASVEVFDEEDAQVVHH
jgi:hypothetical protein